VRAYPLLVLRGTAKAFGSQLTSFRSFADAERFGEGTGINYEVATRLPREHARYLHSRQQQGRLNTVAFRALHMWVGVLSAIAVSYLAVALRRKRRQEAVLHLLCMAAVVVNAGVIAAAGSPDDRYAARLMWLLTFSFLLWLEGARAAYLAASPPRS